MTDIDTELSRLGSPPAAVANLCCVLMECWWGVPYSWTQSAEDYFRFDVFPKTEEG